MLKTDGNETTKLESNKNYDYLNQNQKLNSIEKQYEELDKSLYNIKYIYKDKL